MGKVNEYPPFRWYVLVTLFVLTVAHAIIMISPAPLVGVISKDLKLGLGPTTGMFMGIFNLALAVACIAGGFICDRFGLVKTYIGSSILLIVPTVALPYVGESALGAIIVRILQAIGSGPINASVSLVAALWFPPSQRGIVTGLQGTGVTLGIAIGFIATPYAYGITQSWQSAMAWQSAASFLALLMVVLFAFGPKPPVGSHVVARVGNKPENGDFKLAMGQPASWVGVAIIFFLCWVLSAFNDLTPAYFAIEPPAGVGYGTMTAGKLMTVVQIAFMVGSGTVGFVFERVFKEKASPVIMIGFFIFAVFAVSIMIPQVYTNMKILVLCLAIAGFFEAWVVPIVFAFIALHYPSHIVGKLTGMWFGIGVFGGTVGVILGAAALHHTGNYHTSIIIVGIIAIIGCVLGIFLKPPKVFGEKHL
ncbi:MAG: MFS transporter [Syntrophorhabdaceae bacterium]|nr:MFS transporter [Syntrophorhabdaceae bacterium]